ncbi:MAG TPA: cache domain-containing protein, partial [Ktedonobacterales bacterium]|nr:cache domain-containing protein [Ktedonobacterales bacterium]
MGRRGLRLGIRAQLTLVLLLGAILSTAATLFIANSAIQQYALQQAQAQEQGNAKIALLVLRTEYGQNISIASDGTMVIDSPAIGQDFSTYNAANNYGKESLYGNNDYVDQVQQLIGGEVSVYQCAQADGAPAPCYRIATTFRKPNAGFTGAREVGTQYSLETSVAQHLGLGPNQAPREWSGVDTLDGQQYYTDYQPLFDPENNVIGVLSIGVPLGTVTNFQQTTTIELLLLGLIIMIAGIIFAVLFASAIVNTLQQAARQVSAASARLSVIAGQQSGGAQQQV